MKALIRFISTVSLSVLLLAPSIVILQNDENTLAIELSEDEENKEEKKELNEDNIIVSYLHNDSVSKHAINYNQSLFSAAYLEVSYVTSLEIFLPPPERIV